MIQSQAIDLNGVSIHYAEASGPGPALLLIHGLTGSHAGFLPLVPALARQAHVYLVDLRGHNLSGRTPGAYQVADYGHDAAAFMQRVVGRPAVLAGHSLGGMVAIWLAAGAPQWAQGLFLEDPPLYITQGERFRQTPFYGYFVFLRDHLSRHHANGGTVDEMETFIGRLPANETQTMLEAIGPEGVRLRAVQLQRLDPATLDPAIAGDIQGGQDPDGLLAQIRCPTHLLAAQAEFGGAMDAEDVRRFVSHAPHCAHAVLEGAGHVLHEERTAEYMQALQGFIADLD